MQEPEFLNWDIVIQLHTESLRRFGGSAGIRDRGLIESALASARNTWHYTPATLFDVAATYAYHIAEAQAFVDGNKRTAIAAALVFLAGNGFFIHGGDRELYDAMIAIAEKRLNKEGLAAVLKRLAEKESS